MTAEATTPPGLDFAVERPLLRRLEHWLGIAVGVPAGLAVLGEVAILLYGVTMRFVFNRPLVWSDELASMVFLWLCMLGAVLALWNGEHMRLTTLSSRMSPRLRAFADTLAIAAPCLFLAMIIGPALDYVEDQSFVQTPALGWPDSIRAAAVPTGCALMLLLCVLRLLQHRLRDVLATAILLGAIAAGLWLSGGSDRCDGQPEPADLFCATAGRGGADRRADCVRLRPGHGGRPAHDYDDPARGPARSDRRGHEFAHSARRAAVHHVGTANRDDGNGEGHGRLSRLRPWSCPRRPPVRAARCDAARLRHFRRKDGRHGGGRTRAVSGDA